MRIGILASVGGTIDAFFHPLIERWHERGHVVVSAASTRSSYSDHTDIKSITRRPSFVNFRAPSSIASWVRANRLDVLVTNTATASFLARARRMPVPVIYFCHGLHWNGTRRLSDRLWQTLEKVALRNTDAVVVINDDDEDWFKSRFDPDRVHRLVGGVGVPLDDFPRTPVPLLDDGIRLLWAGEFSERKRPELAVRVAHYLQAQIVNVHLTMCGDGPLLAKTQELVEHLGVSKNVSLVGRQSDIGARLQSSHALLSTSTWEGLPRIGLESLASGRPVFAFDVKGTRSLPGVLLAPDGSVADLAALIASEAGAGFNSVNLVARETLDPNRVADSLIEVAQKVVS